MADLNSWGKKLFIRQSGKKDPIISQKLYTDGDIDLKTNSNFSPIWKASSNSLLNLVSSSFSFNGNALPTGQFAMQGVQIWESTEPLNFSIKATLYMNTDARTDVVNPSFALMSLPLPTKQNSIFSDVMSEKFNINIKTLIPPGPNIGDILKNVMKKDDFYSLGSLHAVESRGVFDVTISDYMTISNVIVKGVDCNFSSLLDDKGFPTSSELTFEFTTMEIATTDMMDNILKNLK